MTKKTSLPSVLAAEEVVDTGGVTQALTVEGDTEAAAEETMTTTTTLIATSILVSTIKRVL